MNVEVFGYLSSALMGVTLGLIGGGGSILTVPIFVYLFGIDPMLSTAYSLFVVGVTALVGGIEAYLKKQIDLVRGTLFAIPGFLGVYLVRAFLVPALPDVIFSIHHFDVTKSIFVMIVFSVLMLLASLSMIKPSKKNESFKHSQDLHLKKYILIGLEGLIVGAITGFVGAGGGFLIIPALVLLTGMSMKIAIGTSLMIIAVKSLFGFLGDVQKQAFIDWMFLFQVIVIALMGLFGGIQLKKKIDEKRLKQGFGYFVLIMGSFILFDQLRKIL